MRQQKQQTQEGDILIESYRIERELEETDDLSRNKSRYYHANASVIQRAWRESRQNALGEKEHICCDCNDEFPDLFEYYSKNKSLCFCCELHRNFTNKERLDLFAQEKLHEDNDVLEGNLLHKSVAWETIGAILNKNEESYHSKGTENCPAMLVEGDITDKELDKDNVDAFINETNLTIKSPTMITPNKNQQDFFTSATIAPKCDQFADMSVIELTNYVVRLKNNVSEKNLELLKELMVRDDLYTKNEELMLLADRLTKNIDMKRNKNSDFNLHK